MRPFNGQNGAHRTCSPYPMKILDPPLSPKATEDTTAFFWSGVMCSKDFSVRIVLWPVSIIFVDFFAGVDFVKYNNYFLSNAKITWQSSLSRSQRSDVSRLRDPGRGRILDPNYQALPPCTSEFNENKHFISFGGSILGLQGQIFGLRGPILDAREPTQGLWEPFEKRRDKWPLFERGRAWYDR